VALLRYKVSPPPLPDCVDRDRLLRQLSSFSVVALAAPAGHGKTCLAAQLAESARGPVAWFLADELDRDRAGVVTHLLAALSTAWPDLGAEVPATVDDESAVPLFGAALETLAGPGCLVMDDVHLLPPDVLESVVRTAVAALPTQCRLVVCTRAAVPEAVLRAEATGRAVTVGASLLAFDQDECGRVAGAPERGAEIHARTGGWPLAVALLARDSAPDATAADRSGRLAELVLDQLPDDARNVLVVLSRVPRFPARLLTRLGTELPALDMFGRGNPGLVPLEGGWWAPREWLRDALREIGADGALVATTARALRDIGEIDLAVQLLVAEARFEDAVPLLETLASQGMSDGRAAWVQGLIEAIPRPSRTFALDLLAATAAQALSRPGPEVELLDLVRRSATESPGVRLVAQALLASHYRMEGDARLFAVCEEALADALLSDDPGPELAARWPDDLPAAAEILRLYGYAHLFAAERASIERGRRLVTTALDLLDAAGRPTTSQRAWLTYFEVLLFLRPPLDAVRSLRVAAHRIAQLDHFEGPLRLAELATVEYFALDPAARRTIEMAREAAARTGNLIGLAPVASIEVALDLGNHGYRPELGERFDRIAAELAAHPRLAPFVALITAEFGIALVRHGEPGHARRYLGAAEESLDDSIFAHTSSFRCRRLRGLLERAEGRSSDGRATLEALRRDAVAEGRAGLVELIGTDLAEPPTAGRSRHAAELEPSPIVIHVMAPELRVTVDDQPLPAPRGYPAKLLALLVARSGAMTMDAAIEGLWPGADPEVGRNRLHGVLLRLRRSLGLAADGPITCAEGMVRLDRSPTLTIDSWDFEALAARSDATAAAVNAYDGDVLPVQFAYDDTVAAYRLWLRRTFLRLATAVLATPPPSLDPAAIAALARRVDATERSLLEEGSEAHDLRQRANL
jgi:hypothetical protein